MAVRRSRPGVCQPERGPLPEPGRTIRTHVEGRRPARDNTPADRPYSSTGTDLSPVLPHCHRPLHAHGPEPEDLRSGEGSFGRFTPTALLARSPSAPPATGPTTPISMAR